MAYSKTYTRINWQNAPSEATALNETNLNKMDSAIDTLDDRIVTLDTQRLNDESAISTAQGNITALQNGKVDKESGKGLSTISAIGVTVGNVGDTIADILAIDQSGNSYHNYIKNGVVVDSALSSSSTNPVQNKVVKTALDDKVDKVANKGLFTYSDMQFADDTSQTGDVVAEVTFTTQDPLDPQMVFPIYNGVEAISEAHIRSLFS